MRTYLNARMRPDNWGSARDAVSWPVLWCDSQAGLCEGERGTYSRSLAGLRLRERSHLLGEHYIIKRSIASEFVLPVIRGQTFRGKIRASERDLFFQRVWAIISIQCRFPCAIVAFFSPDRARIREFTADSSRRRRVSLDPPGDPTIDIRDRVRERRKTSFPRLADGFAGLRLFFWTACSRESASVWQLYFSEAPGFREATPRLVHRE